MHVYLKITLCLFSFLTLITLSSCQTSNSLSSDELLQKFEDGRALSLKLAKEESDTYAGSYLGDYSCRCRVFLFTSNGRETLNRYTGDPTFSAKQAEYSLKELVLAKEQTKQQVAMSALLRSSVHIQLDESLNSVSLLVGADNSDVSRKLMELRPSLHPSVMILYPEDVGMVETPRSVK